MYFHLELGWQLFLALLTDFMLSWTKLAFNGYWDPFPLHVIQLWHLEILLRKSLAIWVSSSLNTCTTDAPLSLSTVSPSLPLQLSPSGSPSVCQQIHQQKPVYGSWPVLFPAYKCDRRLLYLLSFHYLPQSGERSCSIWGSTDLPGSLPTCSQAARCHLSSKFTRQVLLQSELWRGQLRAASFPSQILCNITVPIHITVPFGSYPQLQDLCFAVYPHQQQAARWTPLFLCFILCEVRWGWLGGSSSATSARALLIFLRADGGAEGAPQDTTAHACTTANLNSLLGPSLTVVASWSS